MFTTSWKVIDAKTGEQLGVIKRIRKQIGTSYRPASRVWYQLDGQPDINADVRSVLAAYLGGERKTKVIALA